MIECILPEADPGRPLEPLPENPMRSPFFSRPAMLVGGLLALVPTLLFTACPSEQPCIE